MVFLGGIRSGKSGLAESVFARELKARKWRAAYLATLDSRLSKNDPSLKARIAAHRARRPKEWLTVECGTRARLKPAPNCQAQLLDGLGLWLALKLQARPESVLSELDKFLRELKAQSKLAVIVLDEVGLGGISPNRSQRHFTDLNGLANQLVCAQADKVWRVDAGLAMRIK